jgi:hypothetical protein
MKRKISIKSLVSCIMLNRILYNARVFVGILVNFVACHSDMTRTSRNAPGDSDGDNYKYETPNNTIMIRGLAQHITENDVSI